MTLKEEKNVCLTEIKRIDSKLEELEKELEKLKRKKVVKEYLEITKHILKCIKCRNNLYKKYEKLSLEACYHPIWYYISDTDITNNKETIIKCSCLLCGREKVAKKSVFQGKIIGIEKENVISYEEARKSYLEYAKSSSGNKKAKKFIKKFFSNK